MGKRKALRDCHPQSNGLTCNGGFTLSIVRAERQSVEFCQGVAVDGYRLPNGEFRVGKSSASLAVGFAKNYLTGLEKKSPKQLEALRGEGFTGLAVPVELDSINGGGTRAETLSLDDFTALVFFAAIKGKKQAIALQRALVRVGVEDWFRLAFGEDQLTLEQKRAQFYKAYAATINWLEEDRAEWNVIAEQEVFLLLAQ
jgi:hypothetical protein